MSGLRPWTVKNKRKVADCKVFEAYEVLSQSPYDQSLHPFYLLHTGDWVNVIPLTGDERVVLVRQWRHGSRQFTLEVPGGLVEGGLEPLAAAQEELIEETGRRAATWESLGHVNPNPALFDNRLHTFLATDLCRVGSVTVTDTERTEVELVPLAEVPELIRRGVIDHALVVSAFALLFVRRGPG
ncbi:MAG: NUDIX hydrolase [Proteobacteria bacterium]|nr:NUDIX hydrolase [Pseudomonadota bacterium]MBU1740315.1 NUDIX hydrolase [Pseudomonadota bacterium]